jgi:flagellar FliL protein
VDEPDNAEAAAAPAKKGGGLVKKLVLIVLLLGAVGAGGAWWFLRGTPAAAAAAEPSLEEQGLLSFEPFLVNLTDAGGNRFLKTTIQLVLESDAEAKHISDTPVVLMHLRSTILELLTQQAAPALVTPEGKAALKAAIKERAGALLPGQKVLDVLFAEFVVQF